MGLVDEQTAKGRLSTVLDMIKQLQAEVEGSLASCITGMEPMPDLGSATDRRAASAGLSNLGRRRALAEGLISTVTWDDVASV